MALISSILSSKKLPLFLVFFALAVRLVGIANPLLDFASYRQTYTAMIAENFALHGIHLLRPEINIIGSKNISEFPAYPAMVALLYRIFGIQEILGRLLSIFFAMGSTLLLFRLAKRLYSEKVAFHASLLFSLLPMLVYYTRTFMLESFMLFLSLLAMDGLHKWSRSNRLSDFFFGTFFLSLAILIKIPVLYLGLPALVLVFFHYQKFRPSPHRLIAFLALLALALLPAFVWYFWIPKFTGQEGGLISASSSLKNSIFSNQSLTLRLYFWKKTETWRLLFLTRPLEYHFTPAASVVLIVAFGFWLQRIFLEIGSKFSSTSHKKPTEKKRFVFNKFYFLQKLYELPRNFSKEVGKRIANNKSLLFLISWLSAVFLFMAAFPGFNSLHEYYQIPLLLPGVVLIAAALDYLSRQKLFSKHRRKVLLLSFLYIGIAAYSFYKLSHRLQINTDYLEIAKGVQANSKPDEPILLFEDLPRPEIFYYAKRRGYILGVFAHADKLPSTSPGHYTKLALAFLKNVQQKGVHILIIPKDNWPVLATNFLRQIQSQCPKIWPASGRKFSSTFSVASALSKSKASKHSFTMPGIRGIYYLECHP